MATTKSSSISPQQAKSMMNKLFHFLEECHDQSKQSQFSDFEHYFTRNFELNNNGTSMCHNLNEYYSRVQNLRSKYSKIKITPSRDEPMNCENRTVCHYTVSFTPKAGGQPISVEIMAMGTWEGEKLSKWSEVTHEKGTGRWDK